MEFARSVEPYEPVSPDLSVENLLSSFKTRSHKFDMPPIIDAFGTPSTTINSCYKVSNATIFAKDDKYVLGFKLDRPYFVHAVVFL